MNLSKSISRTLHLNAEDASFFRREAVFLMDPKGKLLIGLGPFLGSKTPGLESFYLPGFFREKLGRPSAHLYPSKVLKLSLTDLELPALQRIPKPQWEAPKYETFQSQVQGAQKLFEKTELKKVLPVVRWKTSWRPSPEEREHLIENLLSFAKSQLGVGAGYTYGYWKGDEGFLGRTPEVLFSVQNDSLKTMALAGTAWPGKGRDLLSDPKERAEHQWVVKEILEKLESFGDFEAAPLEVLPAGAIEHLYTPIQGKLKTEPKLEDLAERLHPTPALGGYPQALALSWLREQPEAEWRGDFGGPLALDRTLDRGLQGSRDFDCVVLIRGLFWNAVESFIPCGCGIVEASVTEREWIELSKKKESVLKMLGLSDEH